MRRRSVTLLRMLELVRGYDLQLINLQYDTSEAELEVIVDTSNVHAIPGLDARNDLEGLLGLMASLDAVISVDNANAHFAGALGIETLLLLPDAL